MTFRLSLALLLALVLAAPMALADSRFEAFHQDRLAELNDEGKPVLVEVYADWCSTCARQSPILESLLGEDEFADYTALKLDWDEQEDSARELGAPRQSTLFVYRDGEQVEMSVAETSESRLRELLRKGL